MLLMSMSALLFLYAFVYLRWNKPDMERPFKIPGKLVVVMTAGPGAITVANLVLSLKDPEPVLGVPYFKLVAVSGIIATGFLSKRGLRREPGAPRRVLPCARAPPQPRPPARRAALAAVSCSERVRACPGRAWAGCFFAGLCSRSRRVRVRRRWQLRACP